MSDLPDLKNYPFKPAGEAQRLGFCGSPGDVAIDGTRRSPLTVVVQDKNGRTVRNGDHSITLTLSKNGDARLSGTLTTTSVNGIATFPDVTIDDAGGGYQLLATANGLDKATSPAFQAGPGNGLLRECWNGGGAFSTLPDRTEILGQALETPVNLATNFSARIRGEIIPPKSGEYKFWVAAGGTAELWLSTESSSTNLMQIAAVTKSTPVSQMAARERSGVETGHTHCREKIPHSNPAAPAKRVNAVVCPLAVA